MNEGRPNVADQIVNRKIDMVVNTPLGRESFFDDRAVRRAATMAQVPYHHVDGSVRSGQRDQALPSTDADQPLTGLLRRRSSQSLN